MSICHDECFKQYIFNGPFEVIGVYLSCKHLTIPVSPAFCWWEATRSNPRVIRLVSMRQCSVIIGFNNDAD